MRSSASIFAGLSRSQIFCSRPGSAQALKPLSYGVKSMRPGRSAAPIRP